ncbi:hypothetical protein PsAD2_03026 [Pseudovibrio axinellae]|uniref:Uncharacterized protein n=1 Tax=Pseudovibrio axinellae TaxID=989403 RepID=A0A165XGQ0_9HYPH|nr:hypothetical protein [Pseudovibrio axinellae]KZL17689.1 hypothetical protein PsAD2_03026 [Pseudovibrio axinellae]SER43529.1 hypothetical protein SAMN05421798_11055 [Pseudovibrio axinellae]
MILNRIVLRWAVVSALSNYMDEPLPTIAGRLIFDSKIEPVHTQKKDTVYPMCVVYTDYDFNGPPALGYERDKRTITITFEVFIGAFDVDEDETFNLNLPNTDAELEYSLDMFEAQIFRALHGDNLACDAYRSLINSYDNVISRRGATVEGGSKVAARQITVEVLCDRDPIVGQPSEEVTAFLEELRSKGEYGEYVEDLLEAYAFDKELSLSTQHAVHLNYPNKVREALGIPKPDAPVSITPEIVFHASNGSS